AVRAQHPRQLRDVTHRVGEVLDDVRGHDGIDALVAYGEARAVHAREPKVGAAAELRGVDDGLGAVVDTDDEAVLGGERHGPVADAAADVEYHSRTEPGPYFAVARVVQREQRVGRRTLHRPFAGESHHRRLRP